MDALPKPRAVQAVRSGGPILPYRFGRVDPPIPATWRPSKRNRGRPSRHRCADRRLRDLIGPGRRWSYAEISARTLIDVRSLKAYVSGQACPNLAKYKRLVVVMGPEVVIDLNCMLG